MGAFNTKFEKSEEANQKKFNINNFEVNKLKDDEQIFNEILNISKSLYSSYNLHFLNPQFCKELSTVYKKKLFQLDITSLRNIHQQINNQKSNSNSNSNPNLEAVLSYTPSNQDTFIVNEFKTQLQEHLWNHEMELNPQIFANKGIILDDIPMTIVDPQNKLRYINIAHVNELLATSIKENNTKESNSKENNSKENNNKENNTKKQVGGNNNSFSQGSSSLSSNSNLSENSRTNSFSENNYSIPSFSKNIKKRFKNNFNLNNIPENNLNGSSNINIGSLKKKIQNANKQFGLNKISNLNKNIITNTTNKNITNITTNTNTNRNLILNKNQQVQNKEIQNQQVQNKQKINNFQENNSNIKFAINNNLQQFLNQIPTKNNKILTKNNKIMEENQNKNKNKNKKIQFQVRNYETPSTFCKNNESCKMSKNDLCKAITEHFIVRGNIIASILSTLPRKTSNGFEGGYCYQRFLNLDKCQICLPHNYNELMSMDTKSRIQTMMLFINYMTEKECNENKGLFRKLSLGEKKSLIVHGREGNDFNLLYTEYTNNVRVKYIEHLNILLEILNTLASLEGINNEELNALSLKTKETIDSMYHLCQFYYLYF